MKIFEITFVTSMRSETTCIDQANNDINNALDVDINSEDPDEFATLYDSEVTSIEGIDDYNTTLTLHVHSSMTDDDIENNLVYNWSEDIIREVKKVSFKRI